LGGPGSRQTGFIVAFTLLIGFDRLLRAYQHCPSNLSLDQYR
jgi:hypothetical protein